MGQQYFLIVYLGIVTVSNVHHPNVKTFKGEELVGSPWWSEDPSLSITSECVLF